MQLFWQAIAILRWVVLVLGILAVLKALAGWLGKSDWSELDQRLGAGYVGFINLQFILGLLLYIFLSPTTKAAFSDMGAAMADPTLRFFAVEHLVIMLVAVALAHIGKSRSKKAEGDTAKHKTATIFYGLSIAAILMGIPWDRL